MKVCPSCGCTAIAYEMDEDCKLVPECLSCHSKGTAVESDPGTPTNPLAVAQTAPKVAAGKPSAASLAGTNKRAPLESFDVVRAAKARVRELNREIARLEKLKTERDQLKRLLVAANQKTGTVVQFRKAQ